MKIEWKYFEIAQIWEGWLKGELVTVIFDLKYNSRNERTGTLKMHNYPNQVSTVEKLKKNVDMRLENWYISETGALRKYKPRIDVA